MNILKTFVNNESINKLNEVKGILSSEFYDYDYTKVKNYAYNLISRSMTVNYGAQAFLKFDSSDASIILPYLLIQCDLPAAGVGNLYFADSMHHRLISSMRIKLSNQGNEYSYDYYALWQLLLDSADSDFYKAFNTTAQGFYTAGANDPTGRAINIILPIPTTHIFHKCKSQDYKGLIPLNVFNTLNITLEIAPLNIINDNAGAGAAPTQFNLTYSVIGLEGNLLMLEKLTDIISYNQPIIKAVTFSGPYTARGLNAIANKIYLKSSDVSNLIKINISHSTVNGVDKTHADYLKSTQFTEIANVKISSGSDIYYNEYKNGAYTLFNKFFEYKQNNLIKSVTFQPSSYNRLNEGIINNNDLTIEYNSTGRAAAAGVYIITLYYLDIMNYTDSIKLNRMKNIAQEAL